jgi:hypothetical protein
MADIDDHTPRIFTVAWRFFRQHKADCQLHDLSDKDFEELVRLCLTSDRVLIGPQFSDYIYMNELDNQILLKSNGFVTLKRFIDDYFAFLLCIDLSGQKAFNIS